MRDCAAIAGTGLLVAVALRPFPDTPFIDDWAYSWSVQHLLESGELRFPEIVLNPIVTQVLWGALFCLPFGFSLAALRVSTWVLGVLAVCGLYLLVREIGGGRRAAVAGAALLGFNPMFFILATSFMTDVPFLAATLWSALVFVRGLRLRRIGLVWIAAAICAASVGSRVLGIGVAGAMMATLLFHSGRWGRRQSAWLAPALVVPFALWLFAWTRQRIFVTADISFLPSHPDRRIENLRYAIELLPPMLVATLLFVVVIVGIALVPLAVGTLRRRNLARSAMLFGLLAMACVAAKAAGFTPPVPFEAGNIWALREIGATPSFVPGWRPEPLHWLVSGAAVTVALASTAIVIAGLRLRALGEAEAFLLWNILGQALLVAVLWLTYDRYALVFVPLMAALVLASSPPLRLWPTAAAVAVTAVIALAGTHDYLEYNRAVWKAVDDLRTEGVPASEIDGGYVVNGWQQYLRPEQAYRDASGRIIVPMVNDFADLPYTIADRPMSGRTVVRTYPYDGWLRRDGEVLLLKRAAVQAVTARSVTGLVVTQPAAPRATVLIGDGDTASANVRLPDRP
jgi:4-amino-4-deoxy-L-arabinose transferase-like glycosyltransferase